MNLQELLNKACKELDGSSTISMHMERNSAWVEYTTYDDSHTAVFFGVPCPDDTIEEQILSAIEELKAKQKETL